MSIYGHIRSTSRYNATIRLTGRAFDARGGFLNSAEKILALPAQETLDFMIWIPGGEPELHDEVDRRVYEPLQQFGGAVSAEHGIGLEKKGWLQLSRSSSELELMRLIKRSLDPNNILNRGKVIDLVA